MAYSTDPSEVARPAPPVHPSNASFYRTFFLLILLIVILATPYLVEQVSFAYTRGKERAEAQVAAGQLASLPETTSICRVVAKAIAPSVVGVISMQRGREEPDEFAHLFGGDLPQMRTESLGSGVIVDPAGYVITNRHVVDNAQNITVKLSDGRSLEHVRLLGADPLTDIAVLKINASDLIAAQWGNSDSIEVGDPVLAVGNPYGLTSTVTFGIISAKGRHNLPGEVDILYQDFLQTDAAVNPGNSGGPLVNMHAEVVGINTAIVGRAYQGICFAIPSSIAKSVYEQIRSGGSPVHGWLGVGSQPLDETLAEKLGVKGTQGAVVNHVVPEGPADAAGIKLGDVIVEFNGKRIRDPHDLVLAVGRTEVGSKASVVVLRDGQRTEMSVTIGQRPPDAR